MSLAKQTYFTNLSKPTNIWLLEVKNTPLLSLEHSFQDGDVHLVFHILVNNANVLLLSPENVIVSNIHLTFRNITI